MRNSKLRISALLFAFITVLSACSPKTSSSESIQSSQIEQVTSDTPFEEKVYPEKVDYASTLKFNKESGRKFVKVTTKLLIDGDTSHFYVSNEDRNSFPVGQSVRDDGILKIRYLGIDTPESTGQIEEWGKTASLFNKSKLSEATEIYVESNDDKWNLDSTGSRYLGYVWYKKAADSELRCLNLEILQEGFSYAKSLGDLCYKEVFQKTYSQSNSLELPVFSKAASSWKFDDNSDTFVDKTGYVLGTTKTNVNVISFKQSEMNSLNLVKLYDKDFNLIDGLKKITDVLVKEDKDTKKYEFYLGITVNDTVNYLDGKIEKGIASTTTDKTKAVKVYVENDTVNKGYYNMYVLGENDVKNYITLNTSNNIAYMNRDANYYYGAYQEVTIKGLRTFSEEYVGVLVRFECIVSKISGDTLFVQQHDEESGLNYGMQVYLGNSFSGRSLLVVGNKVSICGNFVYYDAGGTYQVSGLTYMKMKPNYEKNLRLIETGVEVPVKEITADELTKTTVDAQDKYEGISYTETLTNTLVTMSNVTVNDIYTTSNGGKSDGAMTLTCSDGNGKTVTVRTEVLTKENGDVVVEQDLLNKTISVKGIVDFYNDSYQVKVFNFKDITIS